jgi:methyl-accepting chemotaxis protein
MDLTTLLIVFIAVTAVAVVLQTLILAGVGITVIKLGKRMEGMQAKVNDQVLPTVEKVRVLVDNSIPKLETVVNNITESSVVVRSQAEKIDGAVTQIVESVRKQADRIDVMTTRTLERVDSTAATVQNTVTTPIRRIGGVLEGVIAGVGNFAKRKETRNAKAGVPTEDRAVPSQEMFI